MEIDILENDILKYDVSLLDILLKDWTTNSNILWACNDYIEYGELYEEKCCITIPQITGKNTNIIQPRISKKLNKQVNRTREKAEVFTPAWICNKQNNLIDEQWFGRKNVFNKAKNKTWKTIEQPIKFSDAKGKSWQDYIMSLRLEITCGEAPYLASRYDTVTGKYIEVQNRVGLLDRKLRIINENVENKYEWFKWVKKAYQSIYGYEYQGDNLLLARESLLYTFIDNLHYRFGIKPDLEQLKEISTIISWNIWQMDGNTYSIPFAEANRDQLSLFNATQNDKVCLIKNWKKNETIKFISLLKGGYL